MNGDEATNTNVTGATSCLGSVPKAPYGSQKESYADNAERTMAREPALSPPSHVAATTAAKNNAIGVCWRLGQVRYVAM